MTDQPPTLRRFEAARTRRRLWDGLLQEAYRYAIPSHDPQGNNAKGVQHDVEVFDNTATNAVQWKKARLHGQLFPPFRQWMDFAPDIPDDSLNEGDRQGWDAYLREARRRFHDAVEASNFHIEIDPALGDACISTGCLMVNAGTPDNPLQFEAVPIAQFIPEEGANGMISTVFRQWSITGRQIKPKWPDADIPHPVKEKIIKNPDAKLSIVEAILHDDDTARCRYEVWLIDSGEKSANGHHLMVKRNYAVSPAIAFRMDKAAGEWMGRGPVLNVLGDIKTANKVVELVLKNASIAITGMWQADDDGILNLANIKLVPGAIIPKAQGSAGLQPLEAPGRFDVSQLVLEQLQESIRRGIMGPSLPPAEAGSRTATEIDARMAEYQAVELPMSLRLLSELDYPLAQRIFAILSSPHMAGSPYYIAPFLIGDKQVKPIPKNPLVRLQDIAEAAQSQQAYGTAASLFPDIVGAVVDRPRYLKAQLKKSGFPAEHFLNEEKQAELEALIQAKMAELQAAQRLEAAQKQQGEIPIAA